MSWRDDTPQPVQDDLDRLADRSLSAAQHFLEQDGEFYPFAMALTAAGAEEMSGADPGEGENPSSQAVIELLHEGLRAQREGLRAAAFIAPVETSDGDAVRVEVEHRDGGPALELLLPYRGAGRRGSEFGELTAAPGDRSVWT
jgi:hypothetical protein